jgi:predicted PurR-regulated permease PerM
MSVPIFDKRTAQVLATIILFVAGGALAWGARRTLIAFLFAIFFAYLLYPLVNLVRRTRLGGGSRGRSILIVYVLLILVVGIIFAIAGPKLVHEGRSLATQLPNLLQNVSTGQIAHQFGTKHGWSWNTQERAAQFLASHKGAIIGWAQSVGGRAAELATNAIWIILIPILAIFFLRDGAEFADSLIASVDRRSQKQLLRGIMEDLHEMLAAYIRAQLMLAGISLVAYTTVLSLLRVPYGLVLGVLGGLMEFIPVVGPLVAAALIFGVAFLSNYPHLLILPLFLAAWRLIQDYVNAPRIMGTRVQLHPLAVLFGVLVGAEIAGVVGVYLSIPVIATLRIVWRRWERYEQLQRDGGPQAVKPEGARAA